MKQTQWSGQARASRVSLGVEYRAEMRPLTSMCEGCQRHKCSSMIVLRIRTCQSPNPEWCAISRPLLSSPVHAQVLRRSSAKDHSLDILSCTPWISPIFAIGFFTACEILVHQG
jgi:hypothetical protein